VMTDRFELSTFTVSA